MWRIKSFFRGLTNMWRFRKEVWSFRGYDYMFNLDLFEKSLIETYNEIAENSGGFECDKEKLSEIEFCVYMIELVRIHDGDDEEQQKHLSTLFKALEKYFKNFWH